MKLTDYGSYDFTEEFFDYLTNYKENDLSFVWHRTIHSSIIYKNVPKLLYTKKLPITIDKNIMTDNFMSEGLSFVCSECVEYLNITYKNSILIIKNYMTNPTKQAFIDKGKMYIGEPFSWTLFKNYKFSTFLRFAEINKDLQESLKDYQGKEFEL
jgi:hypothetical protein